MRKQLLILVCGLVFASVAAAQDTTATRKHPLIVVIKLTPLSRIDPDATVQGAVEVWLKQRHAVQAEFGYGGNGLKLGGMGPSPWTLNKSIDGKEVWRLRVEGRYYTSYFPKYPGTGTYVAIEGLYKQVNATRLDTVLGGATIDPVFVYAPVRRQVYGLHSKIGTQFLLSYNPNSIWSRLTVDCFLGFGIRYGTVAGTSPATTDLFQDKSVYDRFASSIYRPGDSFWRPSISVGLKIGVSL